MASKDPYRQADGSEIPTPWPFVTSASSAKGEKVLQELQEILEDILSRYKIDRPTLRVYTLAVKGFPATAKDTLIVSTLDTNPENFKEAATNIGNIVKAAADRQGIEMRIEVRNPQLMYRDVSSIIPPNSEAFRALEPLQKTIEDAVVGFLGDRARTIFYHMRGPPESQSSRPTILIGVEPRTRYAFTLAESNIEKTLLSKGNSEMEITIEIIPSYLRRSTMPDEKPKPRIELDLSPTPLNGSSIGPRDTPDAGSLCLWVWFQAPGSSQKKRCLLTAYHLVAPGDAENRKDNDKNGISLGQRKAEKRIRIDYPAPFDAGPTKQTLEAMISSGQDTNGTYRKTLGLIKRYEQLRGIGHVIHASGYRFKKQGREGPCYDWALIELNPSIPSGKNVPPPKTFHPTQIPDILLQNNSILYTTIPGETISKIGSFAKGQAVLKNGRSTDVTIGEVTSLKAHVNWVDGQMSREVNIVHLKDDSEIPFAKPGDSGSMVISLQKEWLGMITGSEIGVNNGLAISATELLDDINKATDGGIVTLF